MSSARFAARAAKLSFDVLVALVGDAAAASAEARRAFDEAAARHDPLPDGLVSGVLLLPDLLSPILSSLDATHDAAACVCSQWKQTWQDTEVQRLGLRAWTTITDRSRHSDKNEFSSPLQKKTKNALTNPWPWRTNFG